MAAQYESVLTELGYTQDSQAQQDLLDAATDPATGGGDMSASGKYEVLAAWTKGDLTVFTERNTAPDVDSVDDMVAIVTHPPVLVIERGGERVAAVPPRDTTALRNVLTELGG
jgi:hypothetical protein